jgi:TolA-binding protein
VSLDLHPEELLYQKTIRALGPDEQADLDAHVARCGACAMHVALQPAMRQAASPSEADYALAARAVERLLRSDASTKGIAPAKPSSRFGGRGPAVARVAAVVALLLGVSLAGSALMAHFRRPPAVVPESLPAQPRAAPPVGRRVARAADAPALAAAPSAERLDDPPAPTSAPAARRHRVHPDEGAPAPVAEVAPAPAPMPAVAPAPPADDAASLFASAERARRRGFAAEAERLFRELGARFPGSREEIAARALLGQLLLDHLGRPDQALPLFDRYLGDQPTGALAEEAAVGRAQALERLGRVPDAHAAWRDFLERHPDSVHAELARRRLAATGAGVPE